MFISSPNIAASTASVTNVAGVLLHRDAVLHQAVARGIFFNSEGDTPDQRWSSLIGIVSSIVGNILISFALNIQRYAHIRIHRQLEEKKRQYRRISNRYGTAGGPDSPWTEHNRRDVAEPLQNSFESTKSPSEPRHNGGADIEQQTYLKSPYWWAGIILMTIGEAGNFLAYGFAPASIVSPLGVVALISNCVIAPIFLKEQFRLRDFWGVVIAVCGAVTVVLSAKHEEKKLAPHDVIGAITTMEFEIYIGVTVAAILFLAWASPKYGGKTIVIDLGLVGLFGAYTALATKGISSMLSSSLWNAFTTPITYALIIVLVGTAIMQVKYVNRALQRFDSTQVIPVQFVSFTLSVIIGSAVLYRDFESTTSARAVKFVGGCLLTFFGVFLITSGRPNKEDFDSELDSDDEAESISLAIHGDQRPTFSDRGKQREPFTRTRLSHELLLDGEVAESENGFPASNTSRRSSRVSNTPRPRPASPTNYSASQTLIPISGPIDPFLHTTHSPLNTFAAAPPSSSHAPVNKPIRPTISRLVSQNEIAQPLSDTAVLRPVTPVRHSFGKSIIPGPFISPLSSSVVADTVRRSTDMYGSRRRPYLDLQRTRSGNRRGSEDGLLASEQNSPTKISRVTDRYSYAEDGPSGTGSPSRNSLENPIEERSGGGRRRAQSLGQRLSGFFLNRRGAWPATNEREQRQEDLERLTRGQG